jgi:hypothetical protein
MTISSAKKKRALQIIDVFDQLYGLYQPLNNAKLNQYAEAWKKTRVRCIDVIEGRVPGAKPSMMIDGLEQGLREMPEVVGSLPREIRQSALHIFDGLIEDTLPDFFAKDVALVQAIIARGRLKNDKEFYLIRSLIDRLEYQGNEDGVKELYLLVDNYEGI